jgi:hypothetical protein
MVAARYRENCTLGIQLAVMIRADSWRIRWGRCELLRAFFCGPLMFHVGWLGGCFDEILPSNEIWMEFFRSILPNYSV